VPQNDCFLRRRQKCPKMQSISLQSLHLDEDEEICFALWDADELVKTKLWHALKFGLEDALQDRFNREVAQAWFIIFRFLSRKIIEGMLEHRAKMAEEKAKQEIGDKPDKITDKGKPR
ncbi:hypothetical protein ISCGN_026110, partial [Ixodes scapularis]